MAVDVSSIYMLRVFVLFSSFELINTEKRKLFRKVDKDITISVPFMCHYLEKIKCEWICFVCIRKSRERVSDIEYLKGKKIMTIIVKSSGNKQIKSIVHNAHYAVVPTFSLHLFKFFFLTFKQNNKKNTVVRNVSSILKVNEGTKCAENIGVQSILRF